MSRIGVYRWHPSSDRWAWNPTMYRLLGYRAGAVAPSRALVLAHKHPDDRDFVEESMARAVLSPGAHSCRHRVRGIEGDVHEVIGVAYTCATAEDPRPQAMLRGYMIDVGATPSRVPGSPCLDGHDRIITRASAALAEAIDMPLHAGSELVAHLANAHEVPLLLAAERVIAADLDPEHPGLAGLLAGIDTPD